MLWVIEWFHCLAEWFNSLRDNSSDISMTILDSFLICIFLLITPITLCLRYIIIDIPKKNKKIAKKHPKDEGKNDDAIPENDDAKDVMEKFSRKKTEQE